MLNVLYDIFNRVDAHIYVSDLETDEILFVNRAIRETFGIDENTTRLVCWKDLQEGFVGRCPFCPLFKLEKNPETPIIWEERNTRNGHWYRNQDSVIDWVDGRKAHLQYAVDITAVKEAQREAGRSLGVLENILDGLDAYIYVSDVEADEILFVNRRMKEDFGLGDDVVGRPCWKIMRHGFASYRSFFPGRCLAGGGDSRSWDEYNPATGRHFKNTETVIDWMDGRRVHLLHATDISDIVAAQKENQEACRRLETALSASRAGVWDMSFADESMVYDPTCARLFGLPEDRDSMSLTELVKHLCAIAQGVGDAETVRAMLESDYYRPNSPSRDYHLVFPDGIERFVRNFGNYINCVDGRKVIGMCIDITTQVTMERELMQAKEAAEGANRAKSQLLSNVSHEIRTPLNAIFGMTEILLAGNLTARQQENLEKIRGSSQSLRALINDLLDISRIEAGRLDLVPVDYDLVKTLKNVASMQSFSAKEKKLYLDMNIRGKLPQYLYGDDRRLEQILNNLLSNAVKFTREGGVTMNVSVEDNGRRLCFDVIDTGVGIRKEDFPLVFHEFCRLDTRTNRGVSGTGLGLAITHSLVEMMGGEITVESEYGRGAIFHVSLPMVAGRPPKAVSDAGQENVYAPEANVLAVDDNEVNLNVVHDLLRLSGVKCDTALSGAEAIRMVIRNNKHYDMVFMDHMMPDMDGVEATRKLREAHDEKALVVVALTANAVEGAREAMLAARMNDYLAKPIERKELNRILRRWLPPEKIRPALSDTQALTRVLEDDPTRLLGRVRSLPFLDVDLGLSRIGGQAGAYEKSLRIMARRLPELVGKATAALGDGRTGDFAIIVHGLKGSLGNIGATDLSLDAEAMEYKAKEGDAAFCAEHWPPLAADLEDLRRQLDAALATPGGAAPPPAPAGDGAELARELERIREAIVAFEGDKALKRLEPLAGFDYGETLNRALRELGERLESYDFEGAAGVIDGVLYATV